MVHSSPTTAFTTPSPSFRRKRARVIVTSNQPPALSLWNESTSSKVAIGYPPPITSRNSFEKNKTRLIGCPEPRTSEHWKSFHERFKQKDDTEPSKQASSSLLSKLAYRVFFECARGGSCCEADTFHDDDLDWLDDVSSVPRDKTNDLKWQFWKEQPPTTHHDFNLTE